MARNFQTNGTIIFTSSTSKTSATSAARALRDKGYRQNMVVRTVAELEHATTGTIEADPSENVYRTMISFFDIGRLPKVELPARSPDRLVELRRLDRSSASSVCWKPRKTAGNVTGFLETLLDVPVTTRTLGTIKRIVVAASDK